MATKILSGNLIKTAHKTQRWTETEIKQLAKCQSPKNGAKFFINNFFYIQHPTKGKIRYKAYQYQNELLKSFTDHRFSINMVSRQMGKALCLETPILTPAGFVQLKDLNVGDVIFDRNGHHTVVTYITETMLNRECYKLTFSTGETITADAEHLWTVVANGKEVTKTTVEILELSEFYITGVSKSDALETVLAQLGIELKQPERITLVHFEKTQSVPVRCLQVDNNDHLFLCGKTLIPTHNTTTAVGYLLWYAMFVPNSTILIAAHKYTGAQEIMQRLRFAYETCPDHIRAGVTSYNKHSIEFENGSRVVAQTTTETTGRGMSVSLLYCLDGDTSFVKVRQKTTSEMSNVTLKMLRTVLNQESIAVSNTQQYIENTEYEILTPSGWADFKGLVINQSVNKPSKRIELENGTFVISTNDHRFYVNGVERTADSLTLGDALDTEVGPVIISAISDTVLEDTYEIFDATGHVICVNSIHSHQCDEFAHLDPNIANGFWTSISPTLSTGGKAIITSTPNSDEDQFAMIWKEANHMFDEYGNETPVGRNGFYPYKAIWSAHPDRDDAWAKTEQSRMSPAEFRREHLCIAGESMLTLLTPSNKEIYVSIEDFFNNFNF